MTPETPSPDARADDAPALRDLLDNALALGLAPRPPGRALVLGPRPDSAAARLAAFGLDPTALATGESGLAVLASLAEAAFDFAWCAETLDRIVDVGTALASLRRALRPGGWLVLAETAQDGRVGGALGAPGGHLGGLMRVLAAAGFDLRDGRFARHGRFLCAAVARGEDPPPDAAAALAPGGVARLAAEGRFPCGLAAAEGFDGRFGAWNWTWRIAPRHRPTEAVPAPPAAPAVLDGAGPRAVALFAPWITQGRGGTEHVASAMADALVRRGWRVSVHTFDDRDRPPTWPLDPAVRLVRHPEQLTAAGETALLAALADDRPDVVLGLHMNRTFLTYVWCARRLGVPVVVSEHIDPAVPREAGLFGAAERIASFAGADRIHLLTEGFRATLPEFLQDRIRVIPNTVAPARRLADPAGSDDAPRTVLAVARLIRRKNLHVLIEAFARAAARVPGWRLRVVGDGPERAGLASLADRLGVAGSVSFAGRLEDAWPEFERAQIFALPSATEGFPMTVLEAMVHGLPAIAFRDCPGANEQIVDGETGLLAHRDDAAKGLTDALLRLMQSPSARVRMGAAAAARFEAAYGRDRVEAAWEALLVDAMTARRAASAPDLEMRAAVALQRLLDAGPAAFADRRADTRLDAL